MTLAPSTAATVILTTARRTDFGAGVVSDFDKDFRDIGLQPKLLRRCVLCHWWRVVVQTANGHQGMIRLNGIGSCPRFL